MGEKSLFFYFFCFFSVRVVDSYMRCGVRFIIVRFVSNSSSTKLL